MKKIGMIRSGGQTGADRAALDTARKKGIRICGWCPKGGWAEDYPEPPGILALYPELRETPSERVEQRTVWNVRDADAVLLICPRESGFSGGTELTEKAAAAFGRPCLKVRSEDDTGTAAGWLDALDDGLTLNVAGPRQSESEEAYTLASKVLDAVIEG